MLKNELEYYKNSHGVFCLYEWEHKLVKIGGKGKEKLK